MSRRKQTRPRDEQPENSGFKPRKVTARSQGQKEYLRTIVTNDVTLCNGLAGVGKTHLAIGMAVTSLRQRSVEKIILCRPAVDSGASIGFLPGTMEEKLGPYLTPLFDELMYFVELKLVKAWMEHKVLEIVPLSMMRGRTFNDAFIILDEAQNATLPELRMFLTRLGQNSKMVITGDIAQTDLPYETRGGFQHCMSVLYGIEGIGTCHLGVEDIVRHRLIADIEAALLRSPME